MILVGADGAPLANTSVSYVTDAGEEGQLTTDEAGLVGFATSGNSALIYIKGQSQAISVPLLPAAHETAVVDLRSGEAVVSTMLRGSSHLSGTSSDLGEKVAAIVAAQGLAGSADMTTALSFVPPGQQLGPVAGLAPFESAGAEVWNPNSILAILRDFGPFNTHTGCIGQPESREPNVTCGFTSTLAWSTLGAPFRIADDFVVPAGFTWTINQITLPPSIVLGGSTTSPLTNATLRIWQGEPFPCPACVPATIPGVVIFGDTTTNRLTSHSHINSYRAHETADGFGPGNCTLPAYRGVMSGLNIVLTPGTYFLDVSISSTFANTFSYPVTVLGSCNTGTGFQDRQFQGTNWVPLNQSNGNTTDMPFIIDGVAAPLAGAGGCCTPTGCILTTQTACTATCGNTFQGPGTTCPGTCTAIATGACCLTGGGCSIVAGAACCVGGTYQGNGSTCTGGTPFLSGATGTPVFGGPGQPTTVSHTITVPGPGVTISDINIDLQLAHSWVGDLQARVVHGTTTVTLFDRPGVPASTFGCSSSSYNILIDDQGTGGTMEAACNGVGAIVSPPNYVPNVGAALNAAYTGQNSSGAWAITIIDALPSSSSGNLTGWSVHVNSAPPCAPAPPTGGCCVGTVCTVVTQAACTTAGGIYRGDSTTCAAPCLVPTGACCNGTNCTQVTQAACVAPSVYMGNGTACAGGFQNSPIAVPVSNTLPDGVNVITVPGPGVTITDVNVDYTLVHTWVGDTVMSVSHGATTVTLMNHPCGNFDNYNNIILDDQGTGGPIQTTCLANLTSPPNYIPNALLSAFNGQNSSGAWTLRVADTVGGDSGTITAWSLRFNNQNPTCGVPAPTGGCCVGATCTIQTQAGCPAPGVWLGANTTCLGPLGTPQNFTFTAGSGTPPLPMVIVSPVTNTNTQNIVPSFIVGDVNVDLTIAHTWVGDMVISVTHGTTTITVTNQPCGNFDNYNNIILDDEGTGGLISANCVANLTSPPNYRPSNLLSGFDGQNSSGNWTIRVADLVGGDSGTLSQWSLHLTPAASPCNAAPSCVAGPAGGYSSECRTANINGATGTDTDNNALTYTWASNNPNVTVAPAAGNVPAGPPNTRPIPASVATLANVPPCGVTAILTLTVNDGTSSSSCTTTVTFDDNTAPSAGASLPPAAPLPPQAPHSVCAPPHSRQFLVSCGAATDNCDPAPTATVVMHVTNYDVLDRNGPCIERFDDVVVNCGDVVEIHMVAPPCPAKPPKSPVVAGTVNSAGITVITGTKVVLQSALADQCGNSAVASYDPTVEPSPLCDDVLIDGTCCPAIARPADPKCKVPVCAVTPLAPTASSFGRSRGGRSEYRP